MAHCPTCGQLIADHRDADWLLNVLTNAVPHREVYRGRDGGWWITRGGYGEVPAEAVAALVRQGKIASVYSDCPDDVYHVGPTIDIPATLEARRKHGKKANKIYLQQTPGA